MLKFYLRYLQATNILARFYYRVIIRVYEVPQEWYYNIKDFFRTIKKVTSWVKFAWKHHDYSGDSLIQVMHFKLERLYKNIKEDHDINDERVKSLRICVKLSKRLSTGWHEKAFSDRFDKKWGPIKSCFEKAKGLNGTYPSRNRMAYKVTRANVETPEQEEQHRAEYHVMYNKIEALQKRDQRLLFILLQKHYESWWT